MKENAASFSPIEVPLHKLQSDTRLTRIGPFIRKHKIDELAQLFNVFAGDMGLVGPRPLLAEETVTAEEKYWDRFLVLPGATGLWQAFIPNTNSPTLKLACDARYARIRSWKLDMRLLFRTVSVVFKGVEEKQLSNFSGEEKKYKKIA